MININKQSYKIILFIFILILFNCFTINAYAVDVGGGDLAGTQLPPNTLYVSDFSDGVVQIEYTVINEFKEPKKKILKYYKYAYGLNKYGEKVGTWLYQNGNSLHDEELKQAIVNKELDTDKLFNVYSVNKAVEVKNPEIYSSGFFMWPVSSTGEYVLTGAEQNIQELISKHDIHDFTEVSKPENFCLSTILAGNWDSTLSKNLPDNYNYPIPYDKSLYDNLLNQARTKTNVVYRNRFNLNGLQRHFVNTSQTYLHHASYLTEGNQLKAIEKTNLAKNNYNPSKDILNKNKKEKSFYENQYFFFLTSPLTNEHLTPQKVFSATNLFKEDLAWSFPRSSGNAKVSIDFNSHPLQIFKAGNVVGNYFSFDNGLAIYNLKLEEAVPNFSNTSTLSSLNWESVPPEFLINFQSMIYTYAGSYWKMTDLASKTWTDLNSAFPQFNSMLTIETFNEMAKTNYSDFYKMQQLLTLTMARYFLLNGFSSANSPCNLIYIHSTGTAWNGWDLPVIAYESMTSSGNVTSGNVKIVNELSENINSSMIVIDLVKALNVSEQDYSYILTNNQKPNNVSDRAFKLIQSGIKKENIGIYLTNSERELGKIGMLDSNLENLQPNRPYVSMASIMYEKNFPDQTKLPEILKYNISDYKNIKLEEKETEETKKE